MRSRLAIISILAVGLVTSGAGATLAFQGSSGQGNASSSEYLPTPGTPGSSTENGNNGTKGVNDTTGNAPTLENGSSDSSNPQASRQVVANASGGSKLAFTGFAAIPVIVIGLGLLTLGVVLRRRTMRDIS